MAGVGLLFVGSVLLVNGLGLLGRVAARESALINVFVGTLLVGVAGTELLAGSDLSHLIGASGFLLFGATYIWVGVNGFTNATGTALGWYCGWASVVALGISASNAFLMSDPVFAVLWALWAILFLGFFLVLATGKLEYAGTVGRITVVQSVVTATLPGGAMVADYFDETSVVLLALAVLCLAWCGGEMVKVALRRQATPVPG